jgi:hypothetical protein
MQNKFKKGDIVRFKKKFNMFSYVDCKYTVVLIYDNSVYIKNKQETLYESWHYEYFEYDKSYIRKMKIENIKNGI